MDGKLKALCGLDNRKVKGEIFLNLMSAAAEAAKKVLSHQLEITMKKKHLSKVSITKRRRMSRSALARLLDPKNSSVTLQTLGKAATVLGKKIKISLV